MDEIFYQVIKMLKNIFKSVGFTNILKHNFGLIKFNLPDLGQKIKEGTIKQLYVKEGDEVSEFQKIADVASDKQFTEITASDSGIIRKIHYKEEDVCQVGDLFLEIETQDGEVAVAKVQSVKQQQKKEVVQERKGEKAYEGEILATPYVRGLLKSKNIDINKIKGSGQNGRILQKDIDSFLANKSSPSVQSQQKAYISESSSSKLVQMNNFEKGMQKSMTESNKIPHLYLHEQFDITQTQKMRKAIKNNQTKVTLMGILIKTFSMALKKYPIVNSTYQPDQNQFQYNIHRNHNISIAIDSPNGLVVPNIKNVQQLSLTNIQDELERLRKLSAEGRLTSNQLKEGTVCLSNIGTIGGINACPLILPPQVCIVAIGKMLTVPKFINDQVVARTVITVSYGCDHRVIDGATVARFSNEWKKVLENPYIAMAQMY